MSREFTVGVCSHEGKRKRLYTAYTVWFNPNWPQCCVHKVIADNGKQAKAIAIDAHKAMCDRGSVVSACTTFRLPKKL